MDLNKVNIEKLPADVRRVFKQLQVLHAEKKIQNKAKSDFLSFVKCMWPDFVEGSHHRHIADKFNKLATGEIKRLIVNMPPRHTKSEFASYLLPSWMVGREPKLKIIQTTHNAELAVRFGRKAKNLIDSEDYQKIFKTSLGKIIVFFSDEQAFFAKVNEVIITENNENVSQTILLNNQLKSAFGNEIIKTKNISTNENLLNALIAQY